MQSVKWLSKSRVVAWTVSDCELNTSAFNTIEPRTNPWPHHNVKKGNPWYLHSSSIKLILYKSPKVLRLKVGFELRCFQLLSLTAWLPSSARPDNW